MVTEQWISKSRPWGNLPVMPFRARDDDEATLQGRARASPIRAARRTGWLPGKVGRAVTSCAGLPWQREHRRLHKFARDEAAPVNVVGQPTARW